MTEQQQAEVEQPFITHLLELRDRLLRMIVAVLVFFVVLFPFANDIYVFVAEPLMRHLPEGTSMIATQVASPFLTPFKMSLVASIFLAMPVILYQFWAFVAPGLYMHEKRMITPLLISSIILFYLGMVFAYFVVFPLVFGFLTGTAPEGVAVMTDITSYLDFVLTLFFAFGIAFEVPIATIVLVMMGVTTPASLRSKRPYIIVVAFIVGMFLTPPDVISQTLLALPMWILFEFGVFFSVMFTKNKGRDEDEDTDSEPDPDPAPVGGSGAGTAGVAAAASSTAASSAEEAGSASEMTPAEKLMERVRDERPLKYPEDFVPMTDAEMEAELDNMDDDDDDDEEDNAEDAIPEADDFSDIDDMYSDHDDHSGDGDSEATGHNPVDVKLVQVMEYREENNLKAARALLYEVLEEGDESQIRVARNILAELDTED